ncbi:MAG: hypothetical protein Q7S45_01455 [Candidatus Curtissbacteria bacterium]|nr:hypothetical protein [Candidatus Curtissbacteria bacterium]
MAEREDGEHKEEPDRGAIIMVEPVELRIGGDGSTEIIAKMSILATDEGAADAAVEKFVRMTGGKLAGRTSGDSRIAFSSGQWNAPWEPIGPKPNWHAGPSPGDPSLN